MYRNTIGRSWDDQSCTDNENVRNFALSNKIRDETREKQSQAYSPEEQRTSLNCHEYLEGLSDNLRIYTDDSANLCQCLL